MSLRDQFDERSLGLAKLLYDYDLLGVYQDPSIAPDDVEEYDDLVGTLRTGLESGMSPTELSEVFAQQLRDQYGLERALAEYEYAFCEGVYVWWHDIDERVSLRVRERIVREFPTRSDARTVFRLVAEAHDSERIQAAVVVAGRGRMPGIEEAVALARLDWRDLLVNTGLAHDNWPAVLDAEFGTE